MDRKSTILLYVFLGMIVISISFLYRRAFITKDFSLSTEGLESYEYTH